VDNLRAFWETWNTREAPDMSLLDPEVTYEDTILPDHVGETYRGPEGVARALARWFEPFEEITISLERIVGEGDCLVSIHVVRTKARHTGIEFESPLAYLYRLRDGKVIHFKSFWDPQQALESAGLSEQEMSQENVEIVRRGTALLNEGKWDALLDLFHRDVEFCDLANAVDTPQVLRGAEAIQALLIGWSEAWDDFGLEVCEYLDADPFVICDTRWYGTGRESNVTIDVRQADVYELRDGKLIRVTLGHATAAEALKAVGLEE